jgi:hypothetical protein
VDRTPRNTNMLLWHRRLWLIDHGASLYFHHTWKNYLARSRDPFLLIKEHVLLDSAASLREVDEPLASHLPRSVIEGIIEAVPESWLAGEPLFKGTRAHRDAYIEYLRRRLEPPRVFLEEAVRARSV